MKKMYGRFQQKHDTEANWLLATNFAPLEGELIIYDADDNYDYPRIKIGIWDGTSEKTDDMLVSNLLFVNDISFDILTNGSIGLKYALYDDHAEFIGLGECTDALVEIASMVQGLYVTAIGDNALNGGENITEVMIPKKIASIGASAFSGCTSLNRIYYGGLEDDWAAIDISEGNDVLDGINIYYYSAVRPSVIEDKYWHYVDNEITIFSSIGLAYSLNDDDASYSVAGLGTCIDNNIVIPNTYNNLPVTSIGGGAFYNCTSLTSVVIPDSVTSIGRSAFQGCVNLTDVYYTGTEEQWNAITIGANNTYLTNATIHYNWEG